MEQKKWGFYDGLINGASEELITGNHTMLIVQKQTDKDFVLERGQFQFDTVLSLIRTGQGLALAESAVLDLQGFEDDLVIIGHTVTLVAASNV